MSTDASRSPHVTVLGGGIAGLAVGHYARLRGLPCTILEASAHLGGLARTLRRGAHAFDLGAHRFHDKDPGVTRDVLSLLGDRMHRVSLGSHIWHHGQFVKFPPSVLNLLATLGPGTLARSVIEIVGARMSRLPQRPSFEDVMVRAYGRTLADLFLLNYSAKLWGVSCSRLSPQAGGGRLTGLTVSAAMKEAFSRRTAPAGHVDGSFYYPVGGIGEIADRLAGSCGDSGLRTGVRVTRVLHAGGTITAVETNGRERLPVDRIVSTIPLPQLAALFDPPLSADLVADAAQLRFRGLRIVALCLDRPAVTRSATVYFPDRSLPFTRVFEPRNRSAAMSPPGQTSLVAEIPCAETDPVWTQSDESLTAEIARVLASLHGFRPDQVTATAAVRASGAYPVLDLDGERRAQRVRDGLGDFRNLDLAGRSGRFEYAWIHGLLREGRRIVEQMS